MVQREVNNVVFYSVMEDGSQTAEIRSVQASMYMQREFVHGLPLKTAQEMYGELIKLIHAEKVPNETKLQNVAVLVHNLQVRIANVINYDNLLGLACIYFYIDGEDPAMHDGRYDAKKLALMKAGTSDDIVFFCKKACEYTPQLKLISETDLLNYLETANNIISSQKMNTHI